MRARGARLCAALTVAAIAFAGCGEDDDEPADSGGTGAQGASGVEGGTDMTAEEFLLKLLPDKEAAIEAVVATAPECEGVKVEPSLVLVVSDAASEADPRAPLTELVVEQC